MAVPSPLFLLLAAFVCSMVGRAFLFRAALGISKGWGIAVLCVPFAPFFFRKNYKELAPDGQNWRRCALICGILFFVVTGSTGSLNDLLAMVPEKLQPAWLVEKLQPIELAAGTPAVVAAPATVPAAVPAAPPATPAPPSYAERLTANQQEFAHLAEVYDALKHERGYLRKHDVEGVNAYNTAVAKYQADLAKARAEQTELTKLVAKK
jgi:hypothetical protein